MLKILLRYFLYLMILVLLLELSKRILTPLAGASSFVWTIRLSALQFLLSAGGNTGVLVWIILKRRLTSIPAFLVAMVLSLLLLSGAEYQVTRWLQKPSTIPAAQTDNFLYYYDHFDARLLQYETTAVAYDKNLYYKFKPGVDYRFVNREFTTSIHTNSAGLRDAETALKGPEIIFLGDSHTMGWGVEQKEAFPALVQQESRAIVLNAGIPSFGTARELKLLQELDHSNLRHLVIQFCSNDVEENAQAFANGGVLTVSSQGSYDSITHLYAGIRAYFPFKHISVLGNRIIKQQLGLLFGNEIKGYGRNPNTLPGAIYADQFWQLVLQSGIDLSRINITVLAFDHTGNLKNDWANSLANALRKADPEAVYRNRIQIIDIYKSLRSSDFFILDPHMKPSGHRKVANLILSTLKASVALK